MKLQAVINFLENLAPPALQESYDNSGLIVGRSEMKVKGIMVCLDSTEEVLDEAIKKKCNVIIAHHPIVFSGLKSITGRNYVERVIIKAIKKDIAIYAIHTNLDNVLYKGVNEAIAEKLELNKVSVLAAKSNMVEMQLKLIKSDWEKYGDLKLPFGEFNVLAIEGKAAWILKAVMDKNKQNEFLSVWKDKIGTPNVLSTSSIENRNSAIGSGLIGYLPRALTEKSFLKRLKERFKLKTIRHTALLNKKVHKVALCGGSGSFLLDKAISQGADAFVSADFKYHQFFDADKKLVITDIGHYESEQFTIDLLYKLLRKNFSNFATHYTRINTNPVLYYT